MLNNKAISLLLLTSGAFAAATESNEEQLLNSAIQVIESPEDLEFF